MAGRAGRRGIDEEGFVFVRLKPYRNDVGAIKHIIKGCPEPIRSQFNASYATILNLYRDLKEDLISIYPLTFHHYQYGKRYSQQSKLIQAKLDLLKHMRYIREGGLTPKGIFASNIFGYELIIAELWEKGFFDKLSWIEVAICICAIVTEVRPGERLPQLNKRIKRLKREIEEILFSIHRWEKKFKIKPPTKGPHFQLAEALRAWLEGKSFQGIIQLTYADEGEIIRNFRMTIQVLRDMDQDMISNTLKQNITKAIKKLNRDIVNAEWQLKI
jgi:superfamily II RNA helicase